MKKIIFIMILAATFIPITHISASNGEINGAFKPVIMNKHMAEKTDDIRSETSIQKITFKSQKIKKFSRFNKISSSGDKLAKKRISGKKRDRLLGLLLLAHGGQR